MPLPARALALVAGFGNAKWKVAVAACTVEEVPVVDCGTALPCPPLQPPSNDAHVRSASIEEKLEVSKHLIERIPIPMTLRKRDWAPWMFRMRDPGPLPASRRLSPAMVRTLGVGRRSDGT
jgi:hypothetical protein